MILTYITMLSQFHLGSAIVFLFFIWFRLGGCNRIMKEKLLLQLLLTKCFTSLISKTGSFNLEKVLKNKKTSYSQRIQRKVWPFKVVFHYLFFTPYHGPPLLYSFRLSVVLQRLAENECWLWQQRERKNPKQKWMLVMNLLGYVKIIDYKFLSKSRTKLTGNLTSKRLQVPSK
jgi:hypothetical protein